MTTLEDERASSISFAMDKPFSCENDIADNQILLKADVGNLRNVQYPHLGDGENKITNALYEDLKTVGYGRRKEENILTYNNPFDPRLTFNGLTHAFSCGDVQDVDKNKEQLAENFFLALQYPVENMNDYLQTYRKYIEGLIEPLNTDLNCDVTKVTLRRCNSGRRRTLMTELPIEDDGSVECKDLFERIKSDIVRSLFEESAEENFKGSEMDTQSHELSPELNKSFREHATNDNFDSLEKQNENDAKQRDSKKQTTHEKRWSAKCWSSENHADEKSNMNPSKCLHQNVNDQNNKLLSDDNQMSECEKLSSSSTIEVTSQSFPPLGASVPEMELKESNQLPQHLADSWAAKLFRKEGNKGQLDTLRNIPEKEESDSNIDAHCLYNNSISASNPVPSAGNDEESAGNDVPISVAYSRQSRDIATSGEYGLRSDKQNTVESKSPLPSSTPTTAGSRFSPSSKSTTTDSRFSPSTKPNSEESRLSPSSKPFVPASLTSTLISECERRYITPSDILEPPADSTTNRVHELLAPKVQNGPILTRQMQPQSYNSYLSTYQTPGSPSLRQQSSVLWNQQHRFNYGVQSLYSQNQSTYNPNYQLSGRDKWSTGDSPIITGQQLFSNQVQAAGQGQGITPPPGFSSSNTSHTQPMRLHQLQTTVEPAIQTFTRHVEYSRHVEQQPYPFSLLGSIAAHTRYAQNHVPLQNIYHNLRQPFYQSPINQVPQQTANIRPTWAAYNVNNNLNFNNCNDCSDDEDSGSQSIVHMAVNSIESIESDQNRESSSKEKAKLKPKPIRSNLIHIIPTDHHK